MLLHKPAGVVTTASDPQGRPTVVSLVGHESRVVPVGRLDVDTTGALLLTNDGPLAHRLAHPRYGVEKVYEVETWKEPTDEALRRLAEGVELEDGPTSPARVRRLGAARFELVLHEGRNRQVRRMCDAVGYRVRRLHRSVYAGLGVDGLAAGRVARADAATSSSSFVERQHRQDDVDRDERPALEEHRLAVARDLPDRERHDHERADVDRVEDEGQPLGEEEREQHERRVEEDGDLRDRVLDDRDREVGLSLRGEGDADDVLDRVPGDRRRSRGR